MKASSESGLCATVISRTLLTVLRVIEKVTLGPLKIGESASLFRKFLYVWLLQMRTAYRRCTAIRNSELRQVNRDVRVCVRTSVVPTGLGGNSHVTQHSACGSVLAKLFRPCGAGFSASKFH